MTLSQDEKLQAIRARIQGVWDDPALLKVGELSTDPNEDIRRILDAPEPTIGEPTRIYIDYCIEAEDFDKLKLISQRLQGGTDRERDEGDKMRLILDRAIQCEVQDYD
ncbi:hypothetical protein [Dyella telluris]|uniref:Uncharacterized protein n=1 Tax=Dyella telluris TaxID=2763498 RepID=A0A7G8Q4J0_9GAMM|nr:hypothetical protein [Dyella telluris]QNK01698.1 hypothetical protein H8F01_00515 [Dyella telluris]